MSLKLVSSKVMGLMTSMLLLVASDCLADRVVTNRTTIFGRIMTFDSQSVVIAPKCSGTATQKVMWSDIEQFGGIEFDTTCNADWHASTSPSTAEGTGPTATWFAVNFNDNTFLWAEDVTLGTDGILRLKVAKKNVRLSGKVADVKKISRSLVYINTIDPAEFKWPKSYSQSLR
jgi:hypothetical protein